MAFTLLQALRAVGIAAAPNGDIYASRINDDIYKRAGGVGSFVALNQAARYWYGLAAAPNGDIYAVVTGGDIYKQTGGAGDFIALNQTTRGWHGLTAAPNGDIYATADGDIYKQTGGVGSFVALNQTARSWFGLAAAPNGDIYAVVTTANGDIYKQTGGTGDFVALNGPPDEWMAITVAPNGDVYAADYSSGIYIDNGAGAAPAAPTGVSCTPGNGANTITFTPTPEATSNNLYWRTTPGVTKANGTKIAGITSPYVHTGRQNGQPYYYIVTSEVP